MQQVRVVIYTEGHRVTGAVAPSRERVSDLLNNPNTDLLELHNASFEELLTERAPDSLDRLTVLKSRITLAVPADVGDASIVARVPTHPIRVELACPLYSVIGTVQHRPADPSDLAIILRGFNRAFVPLTEARVRYLPNGRFDMQEPVVLVNTAQVQFWAVPPGP
jgi:hypothetical protein